MSAAEGRSTEVLAAEVDGLHAQLAAVVAVVVAAYEADGLPVPAAFGGPAGETRSMVERVSLRRRGHLALVVSR